MQLRFCTFTGAGQSTDPTKMLRLSIRHTFIEWGVLYSPARAGKENRYPTLAWLRDFAAFANDHGMNIALHVCGSAVDDLLNGRDADLMSLASQFGRVQLNTRAKTSDLLSWRRLISQLNRETGTRAIIQWNRANADVCKELGGEYGLELLVDSSGGRGASPSSWPTSVEVLNHAVCPLGYAGGLGPENIDEQLPLIRAAATRHGTDRVVSIDMEGKLRDAQDEFDLELCSDVATKVAKFLAATRVEAAKYLGTGRISVEELSGVWLDFWVAMSRGLNPVIPPKDARAAVFISRYDGKFESYQPSESAHAALRLFGEELIALTPEEGDLAGGEASWSASPKGSSISVRGSTLTEAGLRAIVAKSYGMDLPVNPAEL